MERVLIVILRMYIFFQVKKLSSRENFRFSSLENLIKPVKKSLKLPLEKNIRPWKMIENYTNEN